MLMCPRSIYLNNTDSVATCVHMMMNSNEKLQLVNELHKPVRKNFKRRRTIIKALDDLWQADLAEMGNYSRENRKNRYILVVIDCFSKFVWAKPIKNKSGPEVTQAMDEIFKESKRTCKNLNTDQGTEFYNVYFKNLMKKYNVNHYSTYSVKKAAIVERVIRTLKERLYKYFSLNGSYRWIDILSDIVKDYNNRRHRTIGMKPCDVTKSNEKQILNSVYNHIKLTSSRRYKVGDIVRISKNKHVFKKGYTPNWTTELFKIVKVRITNPTTYLLEDLQGRPISGGFYEEELQKTKNPDVYLVEKVMRKRGKKVYIKWLGLDDSHNSWIDSDNIL